MSNSNLNSFEARKFLEKLNYFLCPISLETELVFATRPIIPGDILPKDFENYLSVDIGQYCVAMLKSFVYYSIWL